MFQRYILFFLIIILFSSCISNRNLDVFSSKSNAKLELYNYSKTLKSGDLLDIQIISITSPEYDFFNNSKSTTSTQQKNNRYSYGYLINDEGFVSIPILGDIFLKGKSISEAEKEIKILSDSYLSMPSVKISLLNFDVTVLGEVINPGRISVEKSQLNILEAIGLVNDFTPQADRRKIKIIRLENGQSKIYYLDLSDKSIANNKYFYLESNDVVYVQPLKKRFIVLKDLTSTISVLLSSLTLYLLINQSY